MANSNNENFWLGLSVGVAGTLLGIAISGYSNKADEVTKPAEEQENKKVEDQKTEEQTEDPTKNPIYIKFQEIKKYLVPMYGESKVKSLYGMSNDEVDDVFDFMFTYGDTQNGHKNVKQLPDDLKARMQVIKNKYKIF